MKKEIKLAEGEYKCDLCEGGGSSAKKFAELEDPGYYRCPKCQGTGKLDWIEKAMGKAKKTIPFTKTKITAKNRKLKGNWTIETSEDLTAMYSQELLDEMMKIENKE